MNNVEIIQELYQAFHEKDYEVFQKICTSDVIWIQNEGFPNRATYLGSHTVIKGVFEGSRSRVYPGVESS